MLAVGDGPRWPRSLRVSLLVAAIVTVVVVPLAVWAMNGLVPPGEPNLATAPPEFDVPVDQPLPGSFELPGGTLADGRRWTVQVTGDQADDRACMFDVVDGLRGGGSCGSARNPSMRFGGDLPGGGHVMGGLAPSDATALRLVGKDGTTLTPELTETPFGFKAWAVVTTDRFPLDIYYFDR